jgi:hypothetical protein
MRGREERGKRERLRGRWRRKNAGEYKLIRSAKTDITMTDADETPVVEAAATPATATAQQQQQQSTGGKKKKKGKK